MVKPQFCENRVYKCEGKARRQVVAGLGLVTQLSVFRHIEAPLLRAYNLSAAVSGELGPEPEAV